MQTLLVATHNAGKIREYQSLLADLPLCITSLEEQGITHDVDETGVTFAENALLKARAYAEMSGCWTWADDSGLEVDALNGRPGVYSARYGGPGLDDAGRYRKLLSDVAPYPAPHAARFRCVVALCLPDGRTFTRDGAVEGEIISAPRGNWGFGYDPVFFMPQFGKTMAELPRDVKNGISHRGQASRAMLALLQELTETEIVPKT
ncbi:MAG: RdgB/HAM1 family non-canonical purine NTP pyrophosphatase [Caldilineaceae bacterium]|nr:RdgB/HAM1 family non-canonical purine NTP pyrophosphatase [Caldilineaceae bacterium]